MSEGLLILVFFLIPFFLVVLLTCSIVVWEFVQDNVGPKFRNCPSCRVTIEKNGGCQSMQCSNCGHTFVWANGRASFERQPGMLRRILKRCLSRDIKFRSCPSCQAICEKVDGCNHVKCANCETHFDWSLARTVNVKHRRQIHIANSLRCCYYRNSTRARNDQYQPQCGSSNRTSSLKSSLKISKEISEWISESHTEYDQIVSTHDDENETCRICEDQTAAWELECQHQFCKKCIIKFLHSQPVCPFDKRKIEVPPTMSFIKFEFS